MDLLNSLEAKLLGNDGTEVAVHSLQGKLVAFYFSAHWCPPCREFTPVLKDFYEEVNSDGSELEIVFISSDDNEEGQLEYFKTAHGNWLALPFSSPMRNQLKVKYGVCAAKEKDAVGVEPRRQGIPTLLVVRPDGSEISVNGVDDIHNSGLGALKRWIAAA